MSIAEADTLAETVTAVTAPPEKKASLDEIEQMIRSAGELLDSIEDWAERDAQTGTRRGKVA